MRIGLSYDLKESIPLREDDPEDVLEEYDSLTTIETIESAIKSQGHTVLRLGGGKEFIANILREDVDFVFNIAEGMGNFRSREAQVPAILEALDIPYSGSDPQCLAISLDKPLTKKLVSASGILTPKWRVVCSKADLGDVSWEDFPIPAFVKPANEGSSKGIHPGCKADSPDQIVQIALRLLEQYQQPVMVEEFIDGDEVTVGIVGNQAPTVIGPMRILPKVSKSCFIYSIEVKRDWEILVDYECPAQLDREVLKAITDSSMKVFRVLGCRDFARLDYRVTHDGLPYFLEVNPLPGLGRHGDLPIMAGKMGLSNDTLIASILDAALDRYPQCVRQ